MTLWRWSAVWALVIAAGLYGGYRFVQWRIDDGIATRKAELEAIVQVLDKEKADLQAQVTAESLVVAQARADLRKAKLETAQAMKDRDQAMQSAIAAATAREAVHDAVAKVPQSEVRGRVRRSLARLGLLPRDQPGR
jgi:uncharacterized protein YlxW (UPF0749 family)